MPIRAWGYVAALGLTLATSALADPPQEYRAEEQREQATQDQDDEARRIQSWHPHWVDWLSGKLGVTGCGPKTVDRIGYAEEIGQEDYYTACDLDAQESVANSTRWLLLIALFQTALGVVGTILVWRTLIFNRKAIETADQAIAVTREIGEAQVRAYIGVTIKAGPNQPSQMQAGQTPEIRITITNHGSSPAKRMRVMGVIFLADEPPRPGSINFQWPDPERADSETTLASGRDSFTTLYAMEPLTQTDREAIFAAGASRQMFAAGRVTYDDVFHKPHETRFCFALRLTEVRREGEGLSAVTNWGTTRHFNEVD